MVNIFSFGSLLEYRRSGSACLFACKTSGLCTQSLLYTSPLVLGEIKSALVICDGGGTCLLIPKYPTAQRSCCHIGVPILPRSMSRKIISLALIIFVNGVIAHSLCSKMGCFLLLIAVIEYRHKLFLRVGARFYDYSHLLYCPKKYSSQFLPLERERGGNRE